VGDVHDPAVVALVQDLLDTLKAYNGQGIAAPQIGVPRQVVVIKDEDIHRVLINPTILLRCGEEVRSLEGCLSFPGVKGRLVRASEVHVSYLDEAGHSHMWEASRSSAVAVQHELDHLKGVVLLDYMTRLEKNIVLRRLAKLKKRHMSAYTQ